MDFDGQSAAWVYLQTMTVLWPKVGSWQHKAWLAREREKERDRISKHIRLNGPVLGRQTNKAEKLKLTK